jgi:hypothetical protein
MTQDRHVQVKRAFTKSLDWIRLGVGRLHGEADQDWTVGAPSLVAPARFFLSRDKYH